MEISRTEQKEKRLVALGSVLGAVALTGAKLIVGLLTGSLGILSEAMHSALDLVAALMTFFAVRFADRPPDEDHQFGHGKIENFSALVETLLLLFTCVWIIYEAADRLMNDHPGIEITFWSFAVIALSIFIDFTRSRALMKTARKYNSQALEADALHFKSDIWSSGVVIGGLIGTWLGFPIADALAALFVAVLVIKICFSLGKRAVDDLLDKSPEGLAEQIEQIAGEMPDIKKIHDIKTRTGGSIFYAEITVQVSPGITIDRAHEITHELESRITDKIKRCKVQIHAEPDTAE